MYDACLGIIFTGLQRAAAAHQPAGFGAGLPRPRGRRAGGGLPLARAPVAINTIIFLAVIELLGSALLNFFGISLPIVQLSGGMVIAAMAWGLLNEPDAGANARNKKEEIEVRTEPDARGLEEKAFYPFTFPVTAGPGTLVVTLTLTAHASDPVLSHNIANHLGIFAAAIVLSALVYLCYAYAPTITRAIPPSTAHGFLRVVAFILLCIGVQIGWNGLSALLTSILHPAHAGM